ncbi:hypothetical protein BOTBODRAFT_156770 [Botryobasidium botryosum FD-172 SS1]|uniref:Uncharacterized protein n=1 Tax=Botryobasidium botryosum (strain FD-172 SS1) TaxID=930990 RepID=A0A067MQ45_BOTB1|nr:hypothetical protein BOTBODRAFT_156770 [Botryobasidium botryosum FD-172 SS1]
MDHPDGEEAVLALCDAGANVDAADVHGHTPLHYAVWRGSASAVQLLLSRGASSLKRAESDICSPLHYASLLMSHPNGSEAVNSLLDAGWDVNTAGSNGWTPLHWAAQFHVPSAVLLLLKAGADPRACDNRGCQPLHHAANVVSSSGNRIQLIIMALLQAGADSDALSIEGCTPLEHAFLQGNISAAKVLIKAGATVCLWIYC